MKAMGQVKLVFSFPIDVSISGNYICKLARLNLKLEVHRVRAILVLPIS